MVQLLSPEVNCNYLTVDRQYFWFQLFMSDLRHTDKKKFYRNQNILMADNAGKSNNRTS